MTAVVLLLSFEAMLADEFQVREHGSHIAAQLVRNRPSRCHPIAVASEHHPSPEVRSRCGRLFGRYREHLAAVYVPSGIPCWPDIDWCVGLRGPDGATVTADDRCRFMAHPDAEGYALSPAPQWPRYRRATELLVRSGIREGRWGHAETDEFLSRHWRRELERIEERYPACLPTLKTWEKWDGGYPAR